MKLLLDQNLPERILGALQQRFPGSTHVQLVNLDRASDAAAWDFAQRHGFIIVSKDSDFRHRSFLYGAPPKVVWLRVGNCPTPKILATLLANAEEIARFNADERAAFLIIP
ncbi:MAG: DUF5615 family PIN-like protein [Planctomycetota bacterium]